LTAKEFLQQYQNVEHDINSKLDQIHRLRALATKTTQVLTPDRVDGTGEPDKLAGIVGRIVDMEHEVDASIDQLQVIKQQVESVISELPEASHRNVLRLRYINGFRWEEIAVKLDYTYRNVCYIHGKALSVVEKKIS